MYVSGKILATVPGNARADKPLQMVIYLHGCAGIAPRRDVQWADCIKVLSLIFVLPDDVSPPPEANAELSRCAK